jgi:hypothetical protein
LDTNKDGLPSICFIGDSRKTEGEKQVMSKKNELKPLSKKHQRVLDEYLLCFNQTAAYRKVYPKTTYDSARTLSSNLFANVDFLDHLKFRLDEVHMSADEALKLMADIARGDVADFMAIGTMGFSLDLQAALDAGKTNLIKKVSQKTITDGKNDKETHIIDIERHDRQSAIRDVLKIHGKFIDQLDVKSDGKALPAAIINVYLPDNGRDKKE